MDFNQLLEKARQYLPPEKIAAVEEAYKFALEAHKGQLRRSGGPYVEHPVQVALSLAELQFDVDTLVAALLHDVPEDCGVPISEIEAKFGPTVAKLVDGVTKLGKVSWRAAGEVVGPRGIAARQGQAENLRKMLLAMAEDLRVVFIKLADRLHNMRTLDALPVDKQRSIAQETLEVYAPLAHRLGIWELKWQLEDLAFRHLEPRKYYHIAHLIAQRRAPRESFITQAIQILNQELEQAGIKADISGRPKHLYSIYQKMEKYAALGKDFDEIYDLLALRVLVKSVPDCYAALGVVHNLWHPLPDQFDDYIATPKSNGYQSLHTAVLCQGTTPLEIQIRTYEMHRVAEFGVAAHWRYKEGEKKDMHFEERVSWLRQLVEWHRELSGAEEFLESVKTDIFIDQVFVYTPKGEIKDLPKGSTPLDFAYRIHTDLGHRCVGGKVNGRLVSLNSPLKNGDVVEIITSKAKGPSRDWLNPVLGYVKTSQAREKIRQWFKKQERTENVERGRELLEKMIKQLGVKVGDREKLAKLCRYETLDEFYAAIGYGGTTTHQIALKIAAQQQQPRISSPVAPSKPPTSPVTVQGVDNLLTHVARCCHPVPGDNIVGYITRNRGVTVHRQDCYNIVHEDEKDRLIPVEWGGTESLYPVKIQAQAWDRVGLMRDITTLVAEEKINITSVNLTNNSDHTALIVLTLETANLAQLSRLLARIEGIRGMMSVSRIGEGASVKAGAQSDAGVS